MYSIDTISPFEFTMACIVCIGYISGKLWMYYTLDSREQSSSLRSIETHPNKDKKKGVIKRGPEWPNP
jgi:hypothetical protein